MYLVHIRSTSGLYNVLLVEWFLFVSDALKRKNGRSDIDKYYVTLVNVQKKEVELQSCVHIIFRQT